jgi:HTH-type transcriptional regulator / antitoxin MqsA
MAKNPRNYPDVMPSPESGRPMVRGEKLVSFKVGGKIFHYRQPGWWCSLDDPDDLEGQLVDDDNLVAEMARRTAEAMVRGEPFTPLLIRAIRLHCRLSQREAGEVFGTGEKSFEKYESGQICPSEPTKRLLWLAMQRPELFNKIGRDSLRMSPVPDKESIKRTLRETQLDRFYAPMFEH